MDKNRAQENEKLKIEEKTSKESELYINSEFFEKMIELIPKPIYYKNNEGGYQYVNAAFLEITGLTFDEVYNKKASELKMNNYEILNETNDHSYDFSKVKQGLKRKFVYQMENAST